MPNNKPKEPDFTEMLREVEEFFLHKWEVGAYIAPKSSIVKDKDPSTWHQCYTAHAIGQATDVQKNWPDLTAHEYDDQALNIAKGGKYAGIKISPLPNTLLNLQGYDY